MYVFRIRALTLRRWRRDGELIARAGVRGPERGVCSVSSPVCSIKAIVVACVLALGLAGTAHASVGVSSALLGVGNPQQGVNAPPNGILLLTLPSSDPFGIAAGADGNVWFTDAGGDEIGRISPSTGAVTEFSAGITKGASPFGIAAGPDGNMWFTEYGGNRIGRITPAGVVTEFSAGISPGADPYGIAAGPDGNMWFAEPHTGQIGRITPSGVVTEFSTGGYYPEAITAGPDGNMWFTQGVSIGRITTRPTLGRCRAKELAVRNPGVLGCARPTGTVTLFSAGITHGEPERITAGADGNLWFTEDGEQGGAIARITPAGAVTEFPTGGGLWGIAAGPDGNLWFTRLDTGQIGRITPAGTVTWFGSGLAPQGSSPARMGTYGSPSPARAKSDESPPKPGRCDSASSVSEQDVDLTDTAARPGTSPGRAAPVRPVSIHAGLHQTSPRSRRSSLAELTDGAPLTDHHAGVDGGAGQEHDAHDVVGFPFLSLV